MRVKITKVLTLLSVPALLLSSILTLGFHAAQAGLASRAVGPAQAAPPAVRQPGARHSAGDDEWLLSDLAQAKTRLPVPLTLR